MKIQRALISVSDKTGLEDIVRTLHGFGVEIISTGGTAKKIREMNIPCKDVSEYTGFPEMMDGRVKTLHPKIHGGLLALRDDPSHMDQAKKNGIGMIDMIIVNLYPFEKTISKEGVTLHEAIENIDIGGPSMLRSAAKNYKSVAVITNPGRYGSIIEELKENKGSLREETLKGLAVEVFERTSAYDGAIFEYLKGLDEGPFPALPGRINLSFKKAQDLRYGENPHQKAAFYTDIDIKDSGIANAKQLQGKELSFNNILDLNAAYEIVKEFDAPAAGIIKHTNPCGAASAETLSEAYIAALDCDRLSAFGSIVGLNREVDQNLAEILIKEADFVECIIAPGYDKKALHALSVKKNMRIILAPGIVKTKRQYDYKKVTGGILVQEMDLADVSIKDLKAVTQKKPSEAEIKSLYFGWKIVKHTRSNAIVLSQGTKTVGIGAGQMSRVDSVIIAVRKAGKSSRGSTLASDAFFPKADSISAAHEAGVTSIIQPGGSIKDNEVIGACDKFGISMVFTGMRHFKH